MISKSTDKITVKNIQTSSGEKEVVTETGFGSFRESRGVCYITYKTDSCTVMIRAEKDVINVKRIGDVKSDMHYIKGQQTEFMYNTPYGGIKMNIFTESIFIDTNKNGGSIKLCYTLATGGDRLENNMIIHINVEG